MRRRRRQGQPLWRRRQRVGGSKQRRLAEVALWLVAPTQTQPRTRELTRCVVTAAVATAVTTAAEVTALVAAAPAVARSRARWRTFLWKRAMQTPSPDEDICRTQNAALAASGLGNCCDGKCGDEHGRTPLARARRPRETLETLT